MSLTFQRPDINSFQDLADNPNYQLITIGGTIGETVLLVILNNISFLFYENNNCITE